MNKFEVGKLYTWVPEPEPDEPKYMNEYYMVWKPNRKDIWKKDSYGVYPGTELLRQKSINYLVIVQQQVKRPKKQK